MSVGVDSTSAPRLPSRVTAMLPHPEACPLLKADQLVGLIPGMGRSAVYAAIKAGQIPSVRIGSRVFVPTAALRRLWGLDPAEPTGEERTDSVVALRQVG